ncbi:MAG TPA: TonB-dependent receptor [Phenylobacterium sp.]
MQRYWLASSALALSLVSSAALAQDTGNVVEEVVVTAEKREQSLQDVPVAVSAFTSERREIVGINSIQDMTNFTPGLVYNSSTDRVSLRGVGRLTNVLSGDASVANYNDGVYETFAVQAGRSTLFLDRVEVLRGPQGTLYGRNAIGGALNQISKRPTEDWYAEVRASYANYQHREIEAAISGPTIFDNIQFRLAGSWIRQTEGWIDNIVPGMPDEGGVRNEGFIEGQLQGTFFDDKLDVWVKVGAGQWHNGAGGPGSQSAGWTAGPYPIYEYNSIQLNAGYGCSGNVTNVINVSPLGCVNPQQFSPWTIARNSAYEVRLPIYNTVAGHFTWHADNFDIRYITGGVNYHYELRGPTSTAGGSVANTSNAPIVAYTLPGPTALRVYPQETFDYREYNKFWSHELNLVSTNDSPLQWVAGAYYYHQEYRQPVFTTSPQQAQWNGPFLAPAVFCANTGGVCAPETGFRRYDNQPASESTSYAFYGQGDWQFTEAWKATLGLRYSHDRKNGTERVRLLCFGTPVCTGGFPAELFAQASDLTGFVVSNPAAGAPLPTGIVSRTRFDPVTGLASRDYDASWEAVTGTAGLQWEPDSDSMYYAKYSKGYKAGGFYVGIFTFIAPSPYADKESVDSWEIGLKKTAFEGTVQVNAAAFYYTYDKLQVPISNVSGSGPGAQVAVNFINVPEAVSRGFEAEVTWQPINNLQFLLSYSFNDTEVKRGQAIDIADPTGVQVGATPIGPAVPCTAAAGAVCDLFTGILQREQNLAGNTLPNAPENKIAVNVNYTWELGFGDVTASLSYLYRDVQYGTLFTRGYNKAPDWDQVDARVTWTSNDEKIRVIGYVKNVFDEIGFDAGATGNRFSGFNINPTTFATELVNQGVFSSYSITPPRLFGVEVQYKFF